MNWECLVEALVRWLFNSHLQKTFFHAFQERQGDMESEWAMFKSSFVEEAAWNCDQKIPVM